MQTDTIDVKDYKIKCSSSKSIEIKKIAYIRSTVDKKYILFSEKTTQTSNDLFPVFVYSVVEKKMKGRSSIQKYLYLPLRIYLVKHKTFVFARNKHSLINLRTYQNKSSKVHDGLRAHLSKCKILACVCWTS